MTATHWGGCCLTHGPVIHKPRNNHLKPRNGFIPEHYLSAEERRYGKASYVPVNDCPICGHDLNVSQCDCPEN